VASAKDDGDEDAIYFGSYNMNGVRMLRIDNGDPVEMITPGVLKNQVDFRLFVSATY
jgi:hypothetical protein